MQSATSADRLSADETIRTRLPMPSINRPNSQRRGRLRHPRGRADHAEAIAVILRTEDRERQRAARNGQDAVAEAEEDRERAGCSATRDREDGSADRVRQAGQPGRQQRMIAAEKTRLDDAGHHLRRAEQRAGRHRLHAGRARGLEDARHMRRHRAGNGPGGGKGECQKDHGAIDRDLRFDGVRHRGLRAGHQPAA